jgi:hypothetical protein
MYHLLGTSSKQAGENVVIAGDADIEVKLCITQSKRSCWSCNVMEHQPARLGGCYALCCHTACNISSIIH